MISDASSKTTAFKHRTFTERLRRIHKFVDLLLENNDFIYLSMTINIKVAEYLYSTIFVNVWHLLLNFNVNEFPIFPKQLGNGVSTFFWRGRLVQKPLILATQKRTTFKTLTHNTFTTKHHAQRQKTFSRISTFLFYLYRT